MQRLRNRVGWLWRQLRLGTWFTRHKAEKVVTAATAVWLTIHEERVV
jgi:hypothetical protein